jgi:hypothetical protein
LFLRKVERVYVGVARVEGEEPVCQRSVDSVGKEEKKGAMGGRCEKR